MKNLSLLFKICLHTKHETYQFGLSKVWKLPCKVLLSLLWNDLYLNIKFCIILDDFGKKFNAYKKFCSLTNENVIFFVSSTKEACILFLWAKYTDIKHFQFSISTSNFTSFSHLNLDMCSFFLMPFLNELS